MRDLIKFREILVNSILETDTPALNAIDKEFYFALGIHAGRNDVLKLLDKYIENELENMENELKGEGRYE